MGERRLDMERSGKDALGTFARLRDWGAMAALTAVAIIYSIRALQPISDPDAWWHLRLGQEFSSGWSLSNPGQLTPFATRPWFATQWTLEVLAAQIEARFGLSGVTWLTSVGILGLTVAIYLACRQRADVLPSSVAAIVGLIGTTLSQGPRPQIATFILTAVTVAAWLRTANDARPRWWLVPVSWLWAATHGMWFIGPMIGLFAVLGMRMDGRIQRRETAILACVPVLSVLAAAITPVGPKLLSAPFATQQMTRFVTEWQPPNFQYAVPAIAACALGVVVVGFSRSGRRSWVEILLLALAAGWTILYARTIAVGAVISAPLLAGVLQAGIGQKEAGVRLPERISLIALGMLAPIGLAFAAWQSPFTAELDSDVDRAIERLPHGSVVYNSYRLGGWLEWRHRNVVPVVDGLTDAYEVVHVSDYMDTLRLRPGWYDFVTGTGADYALFLTDDPIAVALEEQHGWRVLESDDGRVLLERED